MSAYKILGIYTQKDSSFGKNNIWKVYSKFNMKSGFWLISIKDKDQHKTTFVIPHEHYKQNVMPSELKIIPLELQHKMNDVYKPI